MELYDIETNSEPCLLYTSDAADDLLCVDLGGRRIIKKKNYLLLYTIYIYIYITIWLTYPIHNSNFCYIHLKSSN